jgi:hypothetical protein
LKQSIFVVALLAVVVPAHAQFGVLDKGLKKVQQVKDVKGKLDDLNVTEEESGRSARTSPPRSGTGSAWCRARRSTST